MKNLIRSLTLVRSARRKVALLFLIGFTSALLSSMVPFIISRLINVLVELTKSAESVTAVTQKIALYIGLFALFGLVDALIISIEGTQTNKISSYLNTVLSLQVFRKLSSLSTDYFEAKQPGAILRKVNDGINAITAWMYDLVYGLILSAGLAIFGLVALWFKFPLIGLIATISFPILVYLFLRTSKKAKPIYKKSRKAQEKADGKLSETFSHITTIRTMSAEQRNYKKFEKTIYQSQEYEYEAADLWRFSVWLRVSISRLTYAVSLGIIAYLVVRKQATVGDIVLVSLLLQQVMGQALSIGRFFDQTIKRDVAVGRLLEVIDEQPTLPDRSDALPLVSLESIEFRNVSFTYPDSKKGAIKNISFVIEGNKTLALVGPSGTGKSTITKLLLRFYAPTEGQILVNGQDIATYTQDSIREQMGVVMQDVALFNTTIEENLAIANDRAAKDAVRLAAKQAHADEFIVSLPKKYKTLVGERGIKLSGGQKQRVAIARAILKDPQLIILDEATSALDSESERLVQAGLGKLMAGRSALVIAHRLSTIMHADEILVMKQGKILERGTHRQLLANNNLYKKLFDLQSSGKKN